MKSTITATSPKGFIVKHAHSRNTGTEYRILYDGERTIMAATPRTYSDFCNEVRKGNNESARFCECFRTAKGNTFIYWRDEETDEDFLTKVPDAPVFDELNDKFWR